jgi:hypothetical protein
MSKSKVIHLLFLATVAKGTQNGRRQIITLATPNQKLTEVRNTS